MLQMAGDLYDGQYHCHKLMLKLAQLVLSKDYSEPNNKQLTDSCLGLVSLLLCDQQPACSLQLW